MTEQPTILREWVGRGWWVRLTDDPETPLRVNTASAAPDGRQAMKAADAQALAKALDAATKGGL